MNTADRVILGSCTVLMFAIILALSLATETGLHIVAIGFVPSIIYIAVNMTHHYKRREKAFFLWIMPLILVFLYFIFAVATQFPVFQKMKFAGIMVLNLMLCYLCSVFLNHIGALGDRVQEKLKWLHGKIKDNKVALTGIKRKKGWLYFLDKDGDVARAPMKRGGTKKRKAKKKSKKKTKKKVTKKTKKKTEKKESRIQKVLEFKKKFWG